MVGFLLSDAVQWSLLTRGGKFPLAVEPSLPTRVPRPPWAAVPWLVPSLQEAKEKAVAVLSLVLAVVTGLRLSYFIPTGLFPFQGGVSGLSSVKAMPCSSIVLHWGAPAPWWGWLRKHGPKGLTVGGWRKVRRRREWERVREGSTHPTPPPMPHGTMFSSLAVVQLRWETS